MVLPPFESLGNGYLQRIQGGDSRSTSTTERYRRVHELRQKIGEYILGEAWHVASGLRGKHVETEIEIIDTHVESRYRQRRLVPRRKHTISHKSEVRGHYKGWRLVQARWALGDYVKQNSDHDGSMPVVTPDHIACRGIALLTDGRLLPYDHSTKQREPAPDWQVDDDWKRQDSLGWALVQDGQITGDEYDDTWLMHKDMRDENSKWPEAYPTWVLTSPGPDTGVYGRGIREGLAALARHHGIVIPEQIEPVQFIGNPLAHMEKGAAFHKLA